MKIAYPQLSVPVGKNRIGVWSILGWILILSISFYFVYSHAFRYLDTSNPVYTTGYKPFAPYLIVHIAGGIIAIVLGPLQFIPLIRKKYTRMHKTIGKVYLLAILVSGTIAIYLAIFKDLLVDRAFIFSTGIIGLALSWFVTAGMALWAIKLRNFQQHQEWMIRSYVVTSGFTIFRLLFYGVAAIEGFPYKEELGHAVAWACWSLPLLITEVILQFRKIQAASKKPRLHQIA